MKWKIVGGILLLVVLAVGILFAATLYSQKQERDAVKKNYGTTVAKMCDPVEGGTADEANMPTGTGPFHAVVLKTGDSLRDSWHKKLPSDYRASSKDTLDIVICVKRYTKTIDKCSYTTNSDRLSGDVAFSFDNKEHFADLVVLNAATGNRIAETTISGGVATCPQRASKGHSAITGPDLKYDTFFRAVETYLAH